MRTHRLIVGVRVISASVTTLALLLLERSAVHGTFTIAVELAYLTFACALAIRAFRRPFVARSRPVATLAVDLLVVVVLLVETHGLTSPFFASALFLVWAADYLTAGRGAIVVTALILVLWIVLVVVEGIPAGAVPLVAIRTTMIVTVPVCLAWRRSHEDRSRVELSRLASWPRGERSREEVVRAMLTAAASLVRVPRVLMVWEEDEEPWLNTGELEMERFELLREGPEARDNLLMSVAGDCSFLSRNGLEAMLFAAGGNPSAPLRQMTIGDALQARIGSRPVMSVGVRGAHVAGRLYFIGRGSITSDDLALAEIVSRLAAAELDRLALLERMRASAANDERMRLARDLHDGWLQSMAALSVQLSTLDAEFRRDPDSARILLGNLRHIVADDQRDLREFVLQAREPSPPSGSMEEDLREIVARFERRWAIRIDLKLSGLPSRLPPAVAAGICSIVHEGIANAAKHSGARHVRAEVAAEDAGIGIQIADDGRGFPFNGNSIDVMKSGDRRAPVALRNRITSLGGKMIIDSSPAGSRLQIRLPV